MKDLKNIDVMWRPAPFWALDDLLEDGELRRQIGEFEKGGMGGFFMHARSGLETPYLSTQFLDNIAACVDEAEKRGMKAWIYDENGWPSGTAGGMVTNQGRKNRARKLVCTPTDGDVPMGGEVTRCSHDGKPYAFRVLFSYNVDVLNPDVIADFINITHRSYKERFADKMPSVIPGSFFDEPQYGCWSELVDFVPWTESLPEVFEKTWGYSILENLESVFFDTDASARVRTHFYKTLTDMFADAFTRQIGDWCEENGIVSTGHLEWEQEFYAQICCTGSIMRHYEFETWPGTDQLGSFMAYPWINRQAASVTSQLDKGRTMVECFGVAGENFSLADRRWLYGVMLALGSDFFVPHISLYSMKTTNKRDHPPFNLHQQPWWGDNRALADEVSRAVGAVTQGKRLSSVLLLDPIVTAHSLYRPGYKEEVDSLQTAYEKIHYDLLDANVIYDVGEETIMASHARVENGKLFVGSAGYDAVILLGHKNMLSSTARLLSDFAAEGGRICAVGCLPQQIEGETSDLFERMGIELTDDPVAFVRANTSPVAAVETLSGRVWSQIRCVEGEKLWFIINYDRKTPSVCRIVGGESLGRVDLSSGEVYACGDRLELAAGEFAVIFEGRCPKKPALKPVCGEKISLEGMWDISSRAKGSYLANCVNLDICSLEIDSEERGVMHTSKARSIVNGISWLGDTTCRLTYSFENRAECGDTLLALESPDVFTVRVNGKTVKPDGGYFTDIAFRTFDITSCLKNGENKIVLTAVAGGFTPCEDIYLVGNFGCVLEGDKRVLTPLPTKVGTSNLEKQGLSFFAGEATLSKSFRLDSAKRLALRLTPSEGTIVRVRLNGVDCGTLWAAPYEVELVGAREGDNLLELTVVNTLRNLLGTFHSVLPEWRGAPPMDFCFDSPNWTDEINLVPVGFEDVELIAE
ncbi:MAG: hypothetical protein IKM04_04080 [Clostridia bacterium]|nr:hypothetical protein [Clostridia bacterium]